MLTSSYLSMIENGMKLLFDFTLQYQGLLLLSSKYYWEQKCLKRLLGLTIRNITGLEVTLFGGLNILLWSSNYLKLLSRDLKLHPVLMFRHWKIGLTLKNICLLHCVIRKIYKMWKLEMRSTLETGKCRTCHDSVDPAIKNIWKCIVIHMMFHSVDSSNQNRISHMCSSAKC